MATERSLERAARGDASEVSSRARLYGAIPGITGTVAYALATCSYLLAFSPSSGNWRAFLRVQWLLPTGLLVLVVSEVLVYVAFRSRPSFWVVRLRKTILPALVPAVALWTVHVTSLTWAHTTRLIAFAMALQLAFASAGLALMVASSARSVLGHWT